MPERLAKFVRSAISVGTASNRSYIVDEMVDASKSEILIEAAVASLFFIATCFCRRLRMYHMSVPAPTRSPTPPAAAPIMTVIVVNELEDSLLVLRASR